MNKLSGYKARLLAGFALNLTLLVYVYFFLKGGPESIREGGDWMAIWNEVPQTMLLFSLGVIMPYLMVWSRCRSDERWIGSAATMMLAVAILTFAAVAMAGSMMLREISLYIGWAVLWCAAAYYALIPPPRD